MEEKSSLSVAQNKLLNGVSYESLPETTIAVSRTFKRQYFQKNTYTAANNEAICDFNTGAEFINQRRSYLVMKVKLNGTTPRATFGRGGATNLIRRVVITSRSGTELSRTEEFNLLSAKCVRYGCSKEYIEDFGQIMGFNNDPATLGLDGAQLGTSDTVFIIPLTKLSPFFEGDGKTLLPPQLAAGLRVQLTLEDDARALVSDMPTSTYEISEISFMLNTTTMVDSWQKQINEESSRDGLTYSFPEWHTTQSSLASGASRVNIEVRKAVARALFAFTVTQTDALTAGKDLTKDNMKSDAYTATSFEWRLGSMYPTQQPIKTGKEGYFLAQNTWDSDLLDCKRSNAVSYTSFSASGQPGAAAGFADGDAIISTSLERNDVQINGVLNIGGLPTNNSRVLSVDMTLPAINPAANRQTFLFMKHLRVCKAYLDNVVVSE